MLQQTRGEFEQTLDRHCHNGSWRDAEDMATSSTYG
jgi:hypothetical protein